MRIRKISEGADLLMSPSFSKFYDTYNDLVIFLKVLENNRAVPEFVKEKARELIKDAESARSNVLQNEAESDNEEAIVKLFSIISGASESEIKGAMADVYGLDDYEDFKKMSFDERQKKSKELIKTLCLTYGPGNRGENLEFFETIWDSFKKQNGINEAGPMEIAQGILLAGAIKGLLGMALAGVGVIVYKYFDKKETYKYFLEKVEYLKDEVENLTSGKGRTNKYQFEALIKDIKWFIKKEVKVPASEKARIDEIIERAETLLEDLKNK